MLLGLVDIHAGIIGGTGLKADPGKTKERRDGFESGRSALSALERAGPHAGQTGVEMAAALLAEAGPLVQGAVLGLPAGDPAAVDTLLAALP